MEIEFKYLIPDDAAQEAMWTEENFSRFGELDSFEKTEMQAIYYDTEDGLLQEVEAAFHIRKEGRRYVATLKWGGKSEEALHEREELSIKLCGEPDLVHPTLDIFAESEKGNELIKLVGSRQLSRIMENSFIRQTVRIDTGSTICEAALDKGETVTDAGTCKIHELELELFSGSIEDVKHIGDTLCAEFGLEPGLKSKYYRGLLLLEGKNA